MNNFNSYIKFLSRNKLYTFINVLGLSVSLMFVILIANYTVNELTTDKHHENSDRICVLGNELYFNTAYGIGDRLKDRYPEIEKTCGILELGGTVEVLDKKIHSSIIAVDTTFFDMFSFEIKQGGDRDNLLVSKNSVVISEQFANKMFGNLDPIGQNIKFRGVIFNISGVVENFKNSAINYKDMIIHVDNMSQFNKWSISEGLEQGGTVMFLQSIEGADITLKSNDMLEYFKTFFEWYTNDDIYSSKKVTLTPLEDIYFSNQVSIGNILNKGDKFIVLLLVVVSVIILIFAFLNYINLTVAQTGFRVKEMSTRRLLGASKRLIFVKIIFEATFMCIVAFLIGLLLAISVEPYLNTLLNMNISVVNDFSVVWVISYIGLVLFLGVISGLIPAVIISRFKPIDVVKGSFTFKSKMIYSKIFITIQSVITIVFIACSITMIKQVNYMIDADLGYNQDGILNVQYWGTFENNDQVEPFINSVKSLSFVRNVGLTTGTPYTGGWSSGLYVIDMSGKEIELLQLNSDFVTVEILGYEILNDYKVAESGVWLNESAMKAIGADESTRSFRNTDNDEVMIKGVIKDFVTKNVMENRDPLIFKLDKDYKHPSSILIEIDSDLISSYREIEKIAKEITGGSEFNAKFIDQQIEDSYDRYNKVSIIMMIFTIIAILISALGLFAMSVYFVQQRSKEIAIRKVFGSTSTQVLKKLVWQFLHLVLIAFVIACPIIWYAMSEWLQQFPYRIDLSVWIFISAGAFTLLISFVTVFWQSSIAANTNPVDSIKK